MELASPTPAPPTDRDAEPPDPDRQPRHRTTRLLNLLLTPWYDTIGAHHHQGIGEGEGSHNNLRVDHGDVCGPSDSGSTSVYGKVRP